MKYILPIAVVFMLSAPLSASAQAPIEPLSRCLADNTTGKDRKDLARWVFFGMAAHPEIRQYATPDVTMSADKTNKVVADIFTRLLTDVCATQTRAVMQQGGPVALQSAFQSLGQLAMQELVSNAEVNASMAAFQKHIDQNKFNRAFNGN